MEKSIIKQDNPLLTYLSGYKGSFSLVGAVLLAGWLLQVTLGTVPVALLRFPVNAFVLGLMVLICLVLSMLPARRTFAWLSGSQLSIACLSGMTLLAIILGLVPQLPTGYEGFENAGSRATRGFYSLLRSWPFVLLYLVLTVNLTAVLVRRFKAFRWASYAFYLNHLGLWLMLVAAGFGAADKQRYVMPVMEGTTEWRVYDTHDKLLELPLAIKLMDFRMETYPPRLGFPPEPKLFESEVVVYTRDEQRLERTIRVNAPVREGAWMIYQYGYDTDKGKDSTWSSFLLVYDRWAPGTYLGLVLFVLGSLCLLWQGSKTAKSRRHESVE